MHAPGLAGRRARAGSGKSYSMVGYGPERGIIPCACEDLFCRIEGSSGPDVTFKVEVGPGARRPAAPRRCAARVGVGGDGAREWRGEGAAGAGPLRRKL